MELKQALQQYSQLLERMRAYDYALALSQWDLETASPAKGKPWAAKAAGVLSGEAYSLKTSPEMRQVLAAFDRHRDALSPVRRRELELLDEELRKLEKIPKEEYQEFAELQSTSQFVWEQAKEDGDFAAFAPYLEKIIAFTRRFAALTKPRLHPYDACLDDYEKGLTVEALDRFFSSVRDQTVPLVERIAREGHPIRTDFTRRAYPVEAQRDFSLRLLDLLGFDRQAGMLAESEHPFTTEINPGDVRLTTHFYENNPVSAILGTVHEVGHGLYEQRAKASPLLANSLLDSGTSMSIHESQSRFYENRIGRSRELWAFLFPLLRERFPTQLEDVSDLEFYRAINEARPGLIRTEADELTYNLHILIRYELERALLEERIQVAELPRLWSEKYGEYLGLTPAHHGEGVLQDIHWAGGMIGYFPSYALGNAYAAQLTHTMEQSLDLPALCARGELAPIGDWLGEQVHQYGRLKTPGQLIRDITGEDLNPVYLTDYLRQKFEELYFG